MTDRETLTYLNAARARHPELTDTLDLQIALLQARAEITVPPPPAILADDAHARSTRGEPMLRAQALTLDWAEFARLFQTICAIAAHHRPSEADAFKEITILTDPPARLPELVREYLSASALASLAAFVLNNALHPFLAAYALKFKALVDDAKWYRGYCPICGGEPDFAALEKESGARRLLCSRCDHEWTFKRSACPFCGEDEPGKLGYYAGSDGVYRLYVCENCKRYLKTIDLRELVREANLPGERVLTLGMDVAAVGAGYH